MQCSASLPPDSADRAMREAARADADRESQRFDLLAPNLAGRFVRPAAKCAAEICGIAESERQRNILVCESCRAKVLQRNLHSKLIQ